MDELVAPPHPQPPQAGTVAEVAWAGAWDRDRYRLGIIDCVEQMRRQGSARLLLDLRGVTMSPQAPPDKFFLGCLIVVFLTDVRCAVLLPKEYITGVLARVGAEAGVQLRTFWRPESAQAWLAG